MRFLLVVKQKKNVDAFQDVILRLLERGHEVRLAVQERLERDRLDALAERFPHDAFALVPCPEGRGDEWRSAVQLLRSARDWVQYLRPPYRHASKLRARAALRFARELGLATFGADDIRFEPLQAVRLQRTFQLVEEAISSDRLHQEFIERHAPDVVLVTPGLHFGSAQADFIKSARALGIPVWMLVFSWDNLSTKGALHAAPDLMFVWNERQRREALELHDFPSDRVIAAGAPRFDEFFTLRPALSREQFLRPLGLDPSAATLLYVCSSRFIAERELPFIEKWLASIRSAPSPTLRTCNVIVRPHPDIPLVDDDAEPEVVTWPAMPQASGWVQRPLADSRALVLRTTYRVQQAFFECLHHAAAVVGLNTSAELEAGIAGRPVLTLVSRQEGADGQANTLHFDYLLQEHGGFVSCAPDMPAHVEQLSQILDRPADAGAIRSFIDGFLRPAGPGPVSDHLARTLIDEAERATARRAAGGGDSRAAAAPRVSQDRIYDDGVAVPEEARKKVLLGYPGSTARVVATPETRPTRRKGVLELDPETVAWLDQHVHPGDVVYDIGAGVGPYTLVVAMHRGGVSVAFEPGFASFKRLCDNLLLNGCARSVVPLPIALGDRTGLLEMEYAGEAGGRGHTLTSRQWRAGRDDMEESYTQPVCAERLDDVVARYQLPRPNAIRVAVRRGAASILRGAESRLRDPQLRSVLVTAKGDQEAEAARALLQDLGFSVATSTGTDRNRTLIVVRGPGEGTGRGRGLLRRVAGRMRL